MNCNAVPKFRAGGRKTPVCKVGNRGSVIGRPTHQRVCWGAQTLILELQIRQQLSRGQTQTLMQSRTSNLRTARSCSRAACDTRLLEQCKKSKIKLGYIIVRSKA